MKKIGFTKCHSELYKVNRHSEASLVNLYALAKPLAVSESHKQEMLSSADRVTQNFCHAEFISASQNIATLKQVQGDNRQKFWVPFVNQVQHDRREGFTLAEVLITLTIIGVIAALTIPNLMQKYKKHQVEVGLKEAYSIVYNALTAAKAEYGEMEEMLADTQSLGGDGWHSTTKYFSEKYIEPYLKFTKKCPPGQSNCRIFADAEIKPLDTWSGGQNGLWQVSEWQELALANGMHLGLMVYTYNTFQMRFIVDINGGKGPNRVGHDIFYFTTRDDNKLVGGIEHNSSFWNNHFNAFIACSKNGSNCAAVIQRNGWKIPDDYPVKKF